MPEYQMAGPAAGNRHRAREPGRTGIKNRPKFAKNQKNRLKIDQKIACNMKCILASIFGGFGSIFGAKLGWKIEQKSIQKGIEKAMQESMESIWTKSRNKTL